MPLAKADMISVLPIGRKHSTEERVIRLGIKRDQGLILNLKTQSNLNLVEVPWY